MTESKRKKGNGKWQRSQIYLKNQIKTTNVVFSTEDACPLDAQ